MNGRMAKLSIFIAGALAGAKGARQHMRFAPAGDTSPASGAA